MKTVLYFKASEKPASQLKLAGVLRAARDIGGFRIQPVDASETNRAAIRKLISFWMPAGVIIDGSFLESSRPPIAFSDIPVVYISLHHKNDKCLFAVNADSKQIAKAAARELLALDYPTYAFVGFPDAFAWSRNRERHFHEMIALHGKRYHSYKSDLGQDEFNELHKLTKWLDKLTKPCGIFAANDFVAKRVIDLCTSRKILVPQEIAVIGVDNNESICLNVHPRISSIVIDMERIGYSAMELLHKRLRNPRLHPVQHQLSSVLMVARRESSLAHIGYQCDIAKAIALIREKACDGLRARDVLAVMRGSRRNAEQAFREATGHSILDEIQTVRMERAKELLSVRSVAVSAVANLCGYASTSAFGKQFRKAFGVSPRNNTAWTGI